MGLPPVPGTPDNSAPSSMASLVPEQNANPSPDVQEQARAIIGQIRQISISIDTISSQFPVASQEFQVAQKAIQQAMVKIVGDVNRTQTTPPTPATLA